MTGVRKFVGIALLLLFCHAGYLRGVDSDVVVEFSGNDIEGLRSLWEAWKTATPDMSSNLLNWNLTQDGGTPWPCYNAQQNRNWRGVTCLRFTTQDGNDTILGTWVVGLELNDASIVGILPPAIGNLTYLVSLILTGNPNLRGPLPSELGSLPLNVLDLHDNGFNGNIPQNLSSPYDLIQLDLSGNQFAGEFPIQFGDTSGVQQFNLARNAFEGNIPPDAFANMIELLTLDLSSNKFTGPLPNISVANSTLYNLNLSYNSFTGLPELSEIFDGWLPRSIGVLDLSGLNISGSLPVNWNPSLDLLSLKTLYLDDISVSGVLNISSMQSVLNSTKSSSLTPSTLQVLSLRNNNITDVLFDQQFLTKGTIKFYLQGNPYCNSTNSKDPDGIRCFCEQYCAINIYTESSKKTDWKAIVIPTVIGGFILGAVIVYLIIILHQKDKHVFVLMKKFEESDVRVKRFDYNELRAATNNFAEERKLGQGGYGAVYKGILTDNKVIAVKQLFMKTEQAGDAFLNEILLISNLEHRNLVSLKGYCIKGTEMLLVYEFVDYIDLDKLLFQGSYTRQVVSWPARMRICLGVAQGLYYLHASSKTKIIHRDIKASNILLDKDLNAKIADFGLARPIEDVEILTQQRAGTIGYTAPEYIMYGQLSEKADVYSFGVLLLEIVSGTRNRDPSHSEDDMYLPTRAIRLYKEERLMDIMDSRLHVSESEAVDVRRVLETAIMCVQSSPDRRPTMFQVVVMLAGDVGDGLIFLDDSSVWPEHLQRASESAEDPLFPSSSAATTSTRSKSISGSLTNGNGVIEISTEFGAR